MTDPVKPLPPEAELARLSRMVMRRQAGLSLGVASVFLALILGLPLINRFAPAVANMNMFGYPASWLFLAVLFYPITVALAAYFVRRSDEIEAECRDWDAIGETPDEAGR